MRASQRGYYGLVCWRPKHETNVGTLWRSAFLYDAAFIGTIGRRYEKQASDTPNTAQRIPMNHYEDVDDLKKHLPHGCPLIGVELSENAVPLNKFWHPPNACYLLGAEDYGLPNSVLAKCHKVVQIPAAREWSMNVATAGAILLYDRFAQRLQ
jgi:tRNA G18 (ribose-2'-O)-methylase SpoU